MSNILAVRPSPPNTMGLGGKSSRQAGKPRRILGELDMNANAGRLQFNGVDTTQERPEMVQLVALDEFYRNDVLPRLYPFGPFTPWTVDQILSRSSDLMRHIRDTPENNSANPLEPELGLRDLLDAFANTVYDPPDPADVEERMRGFWHATPAPGRRATRTTTAPRTPPLTPETARTARRTAAPTAAQTRTRTTTITTPQTTVRRTTSPRTRTVRTVTPTAAQTWTATATTPTAPAADPTGTSDLVSAIQSLSISPGWGPMTMGM